ncbi:MAG: peptidylprolyl isomerase [Thermoguttaceae bacterium]
MIRPKIALLACLVSIAAVAAADEKKPAASDRPAAVERKTTPKPSVTVEKPSASEKPAAAKKSAKSGETSTSVEKPAKSGKKSSPKKESTPDPSKSTDQKTSSEQGPKAKEFYRLQGELNILLAKLASLQIEYRTANEDKRTEIPQQWKRLLLEGKSLEPKLIEAAKQAYAEAPNADPKITVFLKKILVEQVNRDDYEPAADIGRLLMENHGADRRAANLAGIAAMAVNDFDAAERYLTYAAKEGYYPSASSSDKAAPIGAFYLQNVANYKKAWAKEKALRDAEAKADDLPRVLLKTTKGDIVLELFEDQAPNTVANFIHLVQKGFYKNLTFHRVVAGFMAQGGDPAGNGSGGPDYSIACECYRPDARHHFRGSLSMAHAGRDTGGSQFFLTFVPTPHLDGLHTVFGRVVQGMDVLAKLQRRDPNDPEAPKADKILDAEVLRKRDHPYVPKKMPK